MLIKCWLTFATISIGYHNRVCNSWIFAAIFFSYVYHCALYVTSSLATRGPVEAKLMNNSLSLFAAFLRSPAPPLAKAVVDVVLSATSPNP